MPTQLAAVTLNEKKQLIVVAWRIEAAAQLFGVVIGGVKLVPSNGVARTVAGPGAEHENAAR